MRSRLIDLVALGLLLSVTGAAAVNTGGEVRLKWERYGSPGFGREQPDADGYWLARGRWHAEWQRGDGLRAFGEVASMQEAGRVGGPRALDEDRIDLTQAYLEWRPAGGGVRVGRQAIALGSARLVGMRDGPNVPLQFDAVRGWLEQTGWRTDFLLARPVQTRAGAWDDRADPGERLAACYVVAPDGWLPAGQADIYLMDFRQERARYVRGVGRERRRMLGARCWGHAGTWDWNGEAGVQFGKFAGHPIRAWALALEAGRTWAQAPWRPHATLRLNFISGDRAGSSLGTFNAFYPSPSFFGETKLIGPANLVDVVGSVEVRPSPRLTLDLVAGAFRRMTRADGLYNYGRAILVRPESGHARDVGRQVSLRASWQVNARIILTAAFADFTAGAFLEDQGARDMHYLSLASTFRL